MHYDCKYNKKGIARENYTFFVYFKKVTLTDLLRQLVL